MPSVTVKPQAAPISYESVKIAQEVLPKLGNAKKTLGEDTFTRLDTSKDGRLSDEELAAAIEPMSAVERLSLAKTAAQVQHTAEGATFAPIGLGVFGGGLFALFRAWTPAISCAVVGVLGLGAALFLGHRDRQANAPLLETLRKSLSGS